MKRPFKGCELGGGAGGERQEGSNSPKRKHQKHQRGGREAAVGVEDSWKQSLGAVLGTHVPLTLPARNETSSSSSRGGPKVMPIAGGCLWLLLARGKGPTQAEPFRDCF